MLGMSDDPTLEKLVISRVSQHKVMLGEKEKSVSFGHGERWTNQRQHVQTRRASCNMRCVLDAIEDN